MTWQGNEQGFREYTDTEIQQMVGRAGRPQYDTSGTVLILCERAKVPQVSLVTCELGGLADQRQYRDILHSGTMVESSL